MTSQPATSVPAQRAATSLAWISKHSRYVCCWPATSDAACSTIQHYPDPCYPRHGGAVLHACCSWTTTLYLHREHCGISIGCTRHSIDQGGTMSYQGTFGVQFLPHHPVWNRLTSTDFLRLAKTAAAG